MLYSRKDFLFHILDQLNYLMEVRENYNKEAFDEDRTVRQSVERSFEIIGEAANKIDDSFKEENKDIPWKDMIVMRNKLIHNYMEVDYDIVWDALGNDIPKLKTKIDKLLN